MSEQSNAAKKWEEVQKKAFTHWVNSVLAKRNESIENLETGFVNGVHLISLVEILSGKTIPDKWTRNPKLKAHKINNCYIALQFLKEHCGISEKDLNVSSENIVDGNQFALLLGFCWLLLRKFQAPAPAKGAAGSSFEQNLLQWIKDTLSGYSDIKLDDGFKSESFQNGKALLALVNEFDPAILKDINKKYTDFPASDKAHNCETALKLAEEKINLPILIDHNELAEGKTSEKNMVLYLSLFYNAFKEKSQGETKDSLLKRLRELEEKIRVVSEENDALRNSKDSLHTQSLELHEKLTLTITEKGHAKTSKEELETQVSSLDNKYKNDMKFLREKIDELQENIKLLQSSSADQAGKLQSSKDEIAKERDAVREELKKTKEKLEKEKEELERKKKELLENLKKNNKAREELEEIMKKQQENNGRTLHSLRKHLLQHVHDMHVWKVFLEQDREYESEDLHIIMEPELEEISFSEQVSVLDTAISEENEKLTALHKEREAEVAERKVGNDPKKSKTSTSSSTTKASTTSAGSRTSGASGTASGAKNTKASTTSKTKK